uniref:Uncharacterized protein n=1 Tax=Anguilla anguilla TaxID=7936 RepID=A0A0E9QN43_ANGAN
MYMCLINYFTSRMNEKKKTHQGTFSMPAPHNRN